MKIRNITKCVLATMMLTLCSCDTWLDVTPTDRLSEDMLFADRKGYVKALNGVYVELTTDELYGKNLTVGAVDAMGQYYSNHGTSTHAFAQLISLIYTENGEKELFQNLWNKAYLVLASCNTIIEKCEANEAGLTEPYLSMFKGEALALRAMLHFDLLRLFGPIPSELDKTAIPYQTDSKQTVNPLLTGRQVLDKVITDLEQAEMLLKDSDPYLAANKAVYDDADVAYRQFRLNYFAVKALLARAYLWGGNKTRAYQAATEVIAEGQAAGNELFPWVSNGAATGSTAPDRLFSSEVLFAVYHSSRDDIHKALFAPTLETNYLLTFAGSLTAGRVADLYDDKNDYRYRIWATYNKNGQSVLYHSKFDVVNSSSTHLNYMMPLVRMSEMYLIAAECGNEPTAYLNALRHARNCISLPAADDYSSYIASEYKKEMLGEGQLFFYYKRNEMRNIPDGKQAGGTMNVDLAKYVVPLPDSETSERTDVNK